MARTETETTATPQDVWDVLMDPDSYGYWVVGSDEIRGADPDWPQPGSRFHHRVGMKPFTLADHTEVVEIEPPKRLVLTAKARPLGTARVEMILTPRAGGTHITMLENPGDPLSRPLLGNPLSQRLMAKRNEESLRRLRKLAEERAFKRENEGAPA